MHTDSRSVSGREKKEILCKTIRQYSREPVPADVMEKLSDIARDYCFVKNYVYRRYSGIGSLSKLYPGYTIQNEMTESGLRQRLELPSVYFYLAVFDALGDIKAQWSRIKSRVLQSVGKNAGLSEAEKHYLRFLLKANNAFTAVLQQVPAALPPEIGRKQAELADLVDTGKLHRYLCRQVRKHPLKLHTDTADGFSLTERAYRYRDHGIYIATKEKRRRVFIPLTDNNRYERQLYIRLYPQEARMEIRVPVNVTVRKYEDYHNIVGLAFGMFTMLTADNGHTYGEELGKLQEEYAGWIRQQTACYNQNRQDNPGRKKHAAMKNRYEERIHSYINHELNRFFQTEKPALLYVVRLPAPRSGGRNPRINHQVSMWQRGYIRRRLQQKCREQSVELATVLGKDISRECSSCGSIGRRKDGVFYCDDCGYADREKTNTARNVRSRGMAGKIIR